MAGYTLYSMQDSGNCYKARLILKLRGLPFRIAETDSRDGTTRKPEFLAINPNGKVPTLVLHGTADIPVPFALGKARLPVSLSRN